MPGLLEAAAQQKPPEQASQPPEQAKMAPESQETFDLVSTSIKKTIFKNLAPRIMKQFQQTENPGQIIEAVVGRLLYGIQASAMMKGKTLPPKVIIQSAMKAGIHLSEIAQKAGALDKSEEAEVTENAVFRGLAQYAQEMQGKAIGPEEAQQYAQLLQQLGQLKGQKPAQEAEEQPMEEAV